MKRNKHPLVTGLRRVAFALGLRRFVRSLLRLSAYVLAGMLVAALLAWARLIPDRLLLVALLGFASAVVLALVDAARYRLPDAALALDRRLGLRERTVTGLEVLRAGRTDKLAQQVLREALERIPSSPLRLFPYRLGKRLAMAAVPAFLLILTLALPARAPSSGRSSHRLPVSAGKRIAREAEKLKTPAGRPKKPAVDDAAEKLERLGRQIAAGKGERREVMREIRSLRQESERRYQRSHHPKSTPHLERALESLAALSQTRELAGALKAGDPDAITRAMDSLEQALASGGFEARQLEQTAAALNDLAAALDAAGQYEMARVLARAAEAARQGDTERLVRSLQAMRMRQALQRAGGMCQGGEAYQRLEEVLASTEALLGATQYPSRAGGPDYGFGSTSNEAQSFPVGTERRIADRQASKGLSRTQEYGGGGHEPRLMENGEYQATRVQGQHGEGPVSYVEYRAAAGSAELRLARDAQPGSMVEGAEEALSREEIPPGYREQIKNYFDNSREP